jgi:hypothetical protein
MIEETSQTNNTKKNVFLPFWFSLILVVGIIFGIYLSSRFNGNTKQGKASSPKSDKITQLLNYIQREYVDTINNEKQHSFRVNQIQIDQNDTNNNIKPPIHL